VLARRVCTASRQGNRGIGRRRRRSARVPREAQAQLEASVAEARMLGRIASAALGGLIGFAALAPSHAATPGYPTGPIKLLVGFSPGGGLDISCRHWAQRLSARIGQPVVVENRPGASGELSIRVAMASKPDGYTLVCLSGSNTISSSKPDRPFDIR